MDDGWIYICGKQRFLETGFGELRNFVWRWRSMRRYVECRFCLRMCMLDNKLQTFFNLVLFQQLCGRDVCECLWMFLQAAWKQLETTFLLSEMFISNNVCMADFLHRFHWMISALEFDAPARCTSTEWKSPMTATATSTVASSQTSYFACFRVAWKREKERGHLLEVFEFSTCKCKLFTGNAEAARTPDDA